MNTSYSDTLTHVRMFDAVCEERDFLVGAIAVKDRELITFGQDTRDARQKLSRLQKKYDALQLVASELKRGQP
ncbi:MAG: hypothetical protein V3R25_10090 [Nitrosomonadaceae bacterium]